MITILKDFFSQSVRKQKELTRLFLTGFTMGSADLVPGVSGGTIAFIFGVYEELVASIKTMSGDVIKLGLHGEFKKAWKAIPFSFLVPLATGMFTAIIVMSSLLTHLLETQPVYLWSFFFGLVVASVRVVSKRIKKWQPQEFLLAGVALIGAYLLVGAVPVETPATLPAFFMSGVIAICAMILPGVSGSFLLVIMGKYEQVLTAVTEHNFIVLGTVMAGAVIGLAVFSRVLSWLFSKHHDVIVSILTGFMIGSLRKIWPFKEVISTRINSHGVVVPLEEINILPKTLGIELLFALFLAVVAGAVILYLDKVSIVDQDD